MSNGPSIDIDRVRAIAAEVTAGKTGRGAPPPPGASTTEPSIDIERVRAIAAEIANRPIATPAATTATAREPFGSISSEQLAQTGVVSLGPGKAVDLRTGASYTQGTDGTWRADLGAVSLSQLRELRQLAQTGQLPTLATALGLPPPPPPPPSPGPPPPSTQAEWLARGLGMRPGEPMIMGRNVPELAASIETWRQEERLPDMRRQRLQPLVRSDLFSRGYRASPGFDAGELYLPESYVSQGPYRGAFAEGTPYLATSFGGQPATLQVLGPHSAQLYGPEGRNLGFSTSALLSGYGYQPSGDSVKDAAMALRLYEQREALLQQGFTPYQAQALLSAQREMIPGQSYQDPRTLPSFQKGGTVRTWAERPETVEEQTRRDRADQVYRTRWYQAGLPVPMREEVEPLLYKSRWGYYPGVYWRPRPVGFQQGGSMIAPEEIVGVGRFTGKPYFRLGEGLPFPGGNPERLTITPLRGDERRRALQQLRPANFVSPVARSILKAAVT